MDRDMFLVSPCFPKATIRHCRPTIATTHLINRLRTYLLIVVTAMDLSDLDLLEDLDLDLYSLERNLTGSTGTVLKPPSGVFVGSDVFDGFNSSLSQQSFGNNAAALFNVAEQSPVNSSYCYHNNNNFVQYHAYSYGVSGDGGSLNKFLSFSPQQQSNCTNFNNAPYSPTVEQSHIANTENWLSAESVDVAAFEQIIEEQQFVEQQQVQQQIDINQYLPRDQNQLIEFDERDWSNFLETYDVIMSAPDEDKMPDEILKELVAECEQFGVVEQEAQQSTSETVQNCGELHATSLMPICISPPHMASQTATAVTQYLICLPDVNQDQQQGTSAPVGSSKRYKLIAPSPPLDCSSSPSPSLSLSIEKQQPVQNIILSSSGNGNNIGSPVVIPWVGSPGSPPLSIVYSVAAASPCAAPTFLVIGQAPNAAVPNDNSANQGKLLFAADERAVALDHSFVRPSAPNTPLSAGCVATLSANRGQTLAGKAMSKSARRGAGPMRGRASRLAISIDSDDELSNEDFEEAEFAMFGGGKQYSAMNRKEKKKYQNRVAAYRYRLKKKMEKEDKVSEIKQLQNRNTELKTQVADLSKEIGYLSKLMLELQAARKAANGGS